MYDRNGYRKYLNAEERARFFRRAWAEPETRIRAFNLVLFYSGCRISEALNLTVDHVDVPMQCLVIETLKQRKKGVFRAVPVAPELMALLKQLIEEADLQPKDRLFSFGRTSGWGYVKTMMNDIALSGPMATPRGLRHSFAITYVGLGVQVTKIQGWMGHASLKNTAIYLDFVGADEMELASRAWPTP